MDLVATPSNPVPAGAIVAPVGAADGVVLRVARWPARDPSRGTVCVFTGRGEFIEKYFETIDELLARGFAVVAMDWRGQGLSGRALANPHKGHIDDFALFERDIDALAQQVLRFLCPPPYFALGHSMGAAILLSQAKAGLSPFRRIVLSAPMIEIVGVPAPRLVRAGIEIADVIGLGGAFVPGGGPASAMTKPFEGNVLTADPERYARNAAIVAAAPQLAVGDPTVGWLNAAFRLMDRFSDPDLPTHAEVPVLAFSAGEDRIVSSPAIHRTLAQFKTGSAVPLAGARHEILQERDEIRQAFWASFDAFIPGQRGEEEALADVLCARREAQARRRRWWTWRRRSAAT